MNDLLIYDLGFHNGSDARFYLGKGFRVVALEANPSLVESGRIEFQNEIRDGRLTIVNRALSAHSRAEPITFFVNDEKDDWSSTNKSWAEKGGHKVRQISVPSITTAELIEEFGQPYYIKCDIEGEDKTFIQQIADVSLKPRFLSVEGGGPLYINTLRKVGYTKFQIVNQLLHYKTCPPNPPREGSFFHTRFTNTMSGLFGKELPEDRWWSAEKTLDVIERFRQLREIDPDIAPGWIDLHAMLGGE